MSDSSGRGETSDPDRCIAEFAVYELPDGWRAVHRRDASVVVESADWSELFWECVRRRIALSLRTSFAEEEAARERLGMERREAAPGGPCERE